MPRDLEPVDPPENVFNGHAGLGKQRAFFDKPGNDALNQRDLSILESLKTPSVEFNAEHVLV